MNNIGIETSYLQSESNFLFKTAGILTTKEPIVAYEIIHLIYNVFDEHIKTLSNAEIRDLDGQTQIDFSKWSLSRWYDVSENDVRDYFICVSYVANVRTKSGKLWHYNFKTVKEQLEKLKIPFEEKYLPQKDIENEKK